MRVGARIPMKKLLRGVVCSRPVRRISEWLHADPDADQAARSVFPIQDINPATLVSDKWQVDCEEREFNGPPLKLLFVHVCKTGGMALREAIKSQYGSDSVYTDDVGRSADPPVEIDPDGLLERYHNGGYKFLTGKSVVLGHLWIRKYDPIKSDIRATILREPIERAISNYFYWLAFPDTDSPALRYVVDNKLDFLSYARLPIVRNVYRNVFFRDTDMGQFDFIGNYENLKSDWVGSLKSLGINSPPPFELHNSTRDLNPYYEEKRQQILRDPRQMARLRDIFAEDIKFYERYADPPR